MNVEEFLSTMDALRFDDSIDEEYPELRDMVRKCYPYIRKIYNIMFESGMIAESHGQKKHNGPKDAFAAVRKGNRDADKEMFGDGFRQVRKVHGAKQDYKRSKNKVNINNVDRFNESVDRIVSEAINKFLK